MERPQMPDYLGFMINLNLDSGVVRYSLTTIDPKKELHIDDQNYIAKAVDECLVSLLGMVMNASFRATAINLISQRLAVLPDFKGIQWKDPEDWVDFNKRAPGRD